NNIEEYADLPSAEKNGRDHFSLTYYPSKNTAQEGPAAFAGGNVKVEIFFLTNLNKDIDQWIEDEKNNYYHKTNNMLIRDVKIGKHTGKNLTYDGGVYGGGGSTLYLLIKNTGFRASLISEDGKNPPAEALQVISTFEY
ncbi:hypothetical protein HZB74_03290, partial [Candidatus Saccharibacteria bacterium]|nr:hypothetical protein [Candidatus Saccharibacteria bacterium]